MGRGMRCCQGGTCAPANLSPVGGGLTLAKAVPCPGQLQVIFSSTSLGGNGGTGRSVLSASDPSGSPWTVSTATRPLIGLAEDDVPNGANLDSLMVGSIGRTCVAGDLAAGQTITVNWQHTGTGVFAVTYVVVFLPATFTIVKQTGIALYSNGIGYPSVSPSASQLSWAPLGPAFAPAPDATACLFTAMGAWPARTFTPFIGTLLAVGSGVSSIACAIKSPSLAGVVQDPGGNFSAAATVLAGNYQYTQPLAGGSSGPASIAGCKCC